MPHNSRWSFAYWINAPHATEERMYKSQRSDNRLTLVAVEIIASLRSRVSSRHAACVPEPSTWVMMILGFAGIGNMAYRRRKSAMLAA
jgi:PEP-CTERM motif